MSTELFSTLGKIAGLAGICIGLVLYIVFRVLKSADGPNPRGINANQRFSLLKYITIGVFSLSALGIITWAVVSIKTTKNDPDVKITTVDSPVVISPKVDTPQIISDITEEKTKEIRILTPYDSLKELALKSLSDFDFKGKGKLINMLFSSEILECSKLLKVPITMKCSELRKKLVTALKLDYLIRLKNKEMLSAMILSPVLNWTTRINYSDVGKENATFQQLKISDSSKLSLKYTWENDGTAMQQSLPLDLQFLDSNTYSSLFISCYKYHDNLTRPYQIPDYSKVGSYQLRSINGIPFVDYKFLDSNKSRFKISPFITDAYSEIIIGKSVNF